ncbi:hypothetical protein KC19_3G207300 [Ceratodon purpureus]|uniref:Protein kinase domain-containing protein n=1 Tax=Ceratodon purpureus TaxID=3225 RepID=A0A8T0INJ0_CERPU|nr:hypothetical protein KC19_3G207300 [Ceratodon purpureus]
MEAVPRLSLELARVTEIKAELRDLLDKYGTSPIREPISFLHATGIQLDELQFLRLPADFFLTSRRPSLKMLQDHCKMANLSEIFYRCISEEQWLRTVIESHNPMGFKERNVTIHSNVLPRQAYLTRLTCLGHHECQGGFFPATILSSILRLSKRPPHHCEECALAEELRGRALSPDAAESAKFWFLEVDDVELVEDLGTGSEGSISRILWRKGTFARKRFRCHVNFNKELDVALKVSHPNIVHFFGCSSPGRRNSHDLYMELLETDLGKKILEAARVSSAIPRPPFPLQDSLDVLLQIAQAMKHLHEKNFVHGDLKPQNILLHRFALTHSFSQYYLVKVADFGCAQLVDSTGATVERFNASIGTLKYTAPEVLKCRRDGVAPPEPKKIDVYSFGVVAFQVLTGVGNLYEDLRNSEITQRVIQGQLRPDFGFDESSLGDDVRSVLLPLIQRCWNSYPEGRPTFTEICSEIQGVQRTCNLKREKRKGRGKGHAI